MPELSPTERAHKGYTLFLQRLSDVKAGDIAKDIGWAPSKLSELKKNAAEDVILVLAHLGLKVVPASAQTMSKDAFDFLTKTHQRIARADPALIWGDGETDSGWEGIS